jgi:nucleotide-binding universal stress UspA family protein
MLVLPLRKILCPTDLRPASLAGLRVADQLASHFSAEITLLHVIGALDIPAPSNGYFQIEALKRVQAMGSAVKKRLHVWSEKETADNVMVHPVIARGDPAREIVRLAEAEDVDLIVISAESTSRWRRLLARPVHEKVAERAPCPVLFLQVGAETKSTSRTTELERSVGRLFSQRD